MPLCVRTNTNLHTHMDRTIICFLACQGRSRNDVSLVRYGDEPPSAFVLARALERRAALQANPVVRQMWEGGLRRVQGVGHLEASVVLLGHLDVARGVLWTRPVDIIGSAGFLGANANSCPPCQCWLVQHRTATFAATTRLPSFRPYIFQATTSARPLEQRP